MDGLPPPPAPAHGAQQAPQPGTPGAPPLPGAPAPGAPPQDAPRRPVGAPSKDPERDAERMEKQREQKRLREVLPRDATDSRIQVYRCKGRGTTARRSQRPFMKILLSDIERAKEEGCDPKDYIQDLVDEQCRGRGRFQCVPCDYKGRQLANYAAWEIDFDNDEDDFQDEDDRFDYDPREHLEYRIPPGMQRDAQGNMVGPGFDSESGTPPPPPGYEPNYPEMIRSVRDVISNEKEKNEQSSNNMLAMVMQMNQQAAQQQQQQMQMMMQQMAQASQQQTQMLVSMFQGSSANDSDRREREREERIAREREERDRRDSFLKLITSTVIPTFTPLLNKMLEPKQDSMTPFLIEMIKGKDNNNSAKELMGMMNAAAKEQMAMQGEVSRQAMEAAGKTNQAMMTHVLSLSQDVTRAMLEAKDDDSDDPMEKFGKLMRSISPVLSSFGQTPPAMQQHPPSISPSGMAAATYQQRYQEAEYEDQAPAEPEVPDRTVEYQPPPASDHEKIREVLWTIMRLERNDIPADQCAQALHWCADRLPPQLAQAVQLGDEVRIFETCQPVFMGTDTIAGDEHLRAWIQDGQAMDYLKWGVREIQRILHQEATPETDQAAVHAHFTYLQQQRGVEPLVSGGPPQPQQAQEGQQSAAEAPQQPQPPPSAQQAPPIETPTEPPERRPVPKPRTPPTGEDEEDEEPPQAPETEEEPPEAETEEVEIAPDAGQEED